MFSIRTFLNPPRDAVPNFTALPLERIVQLAMVMWSFMETYFPEYLDAFAIDTKTSLYLLGKYSLPRHFPELDHVVLHP